MPPGILDDRPRFQNGSGVERVCYVEVQRRSWHHNSAVEDAARHPRRRENEK